MVKHFTKTKEKDNFVIKRGSLYEASSMSHQ